MFSKRRFRELALILIYVIVFSTISPILTEAVGNSGEVKTDTGWIYHMEPARYKLLSIDTDGSASNIIHDGENYSDYVLGVVGFEGEWVYYTREYQIWRMKEDGTDKTLFLESGGLGPVHGIKDGYLYYNEYNSNTYSSTLNRINTKTRAIEIITDEDINNVTLGEDALYYHEPGFEGYGRVGYIYKIDLATGRKSLLSKISDDDIMSHAYIYEDNGNVFVSYQGVIFKVDNKGNVIKLPVQGNLVDVKHDLLYFTKYKDGYYYGKELWQMEFDGTNPIKLLDEGDEFAIGYDKIYIKKTDNNYNNYLYSADLGGNNITKFSDEIISPYNPFIWFSNDKVIVKIYSNASLERRKEGKQTSEKVETIKTEYNWGYYINDKDFNEFKSMQKVGNLKVWAIKLNQDIDINTIEDSVVVIDEYGDSIPLLLYLDDDNRTIILASAYGSWLSEMEYTIYINNNLRTINWESLAKQIKMSFTTR